MKAPPEVQNVYMAENMRRRKKKRRRSSSVLISADFHVRKSKDRPIKLVRLDVEIQPHRNQEYRL